MYDTFFILFFQMSGLTKNPLASLAALGLAGMAPSNTGGLNPTGGSLYIFIFFRPSVLFPHSAFISVVFANFFFCTAGPFLPIY